MTCHENRAPQEPLLDTTLDAAEGAQARAAGWCRPRRANNAGGALAHGRGAQRVLRATLLEMHANCASERVRSAPKRTPGLVGNERDAERPIAKHDDSTPTTAAKHTFEDLTGSPAAGGRTARLSNGEGHEPLRPLHADLRAA